MCLGLCVGQGCSSEVDYLPSACYKKINEDKFFLKNEMYQCPEVDTPVSVMASLCSTGATSWSSLTFLQHRSRELRLCPSQPSALNHLWLNISLWDLQPQGTTANSLAPVALASKWLLQATGLQHYHSHGNVLLGTSFFLFWRLGFVLFLLCFSLQINSLLMLLTPPDPIYPRVTIWLHLEWLQSPAAISLWPFVSHVSRQGRTFSFHVDSSFASANELPAPLIQAPAVLLLWHVHPSSWRWHFMVFLETLVCYNLRLD